MITAWAFVFITKTCQCIILQFFHGCKKDNFKMTKCDVFLIFALNYRVWVHVRTASNTECGYTLEPHEAVLTSTHNLCFRAKIRKLCIPQYLKPQFYHIKMGFKGVYIIRTCLHDGIFVFYVKSELRILEVTF